MGYIIDDIEDQSPQSIPYQFEANLGFRLSRLVRIMRSEWSKELSTLRLSPPQAAILRALRGPNAHGIRELGRNLAIDPMNLKRYVDALEDLGFVCTSAVDRRGQKRLVTLLPHGELLAEEIDRKVHIQEEWFDSILTKIERASLESVLEKMEIALKTIPNTVT